MPSSSHRAALVEEKEITNLRGTLVRPLFSSNPGPGTAEVNEGSGPLDPWGGAGRAFSVWVVEIGGNEVRATAPLPAEVWGECGDEVEIAGEWVEHPRYGRQISVLSVRPWIPRDAVGVAKWLEQRPGVGPVTAAKVLRGLDLPGPEALEKIRHDPSCLDALDLPENRRAALVEAARAYFAEGKRAEVLSWCYRYGLGPSRAAAVWSAYGEKAPAEISADPWGALGRLDGFGFLLADDVARRLGVDAAAESRLKAAVIYALSEAASGEGHVYLPEKELVRRAMTTLAQAAKSTGYGAGRGPECLAALPKALEALALEGLVELTDAGDGTRMCYLSWLRRAEETVREWLNRRTSAGSCGGVEKTTTVEPAALNRALADPAVRGPLDEVQINAVRTVISSPASALTGPPGTGKTTVTKAIVTALEKCGVARENILLAAPTGRAAKRMAEVTRHKAVTIHRLLGYNPGLGAFLHNGRNPLDGEFLVVDEASMVDLPLMASLLEAVPEEMNVIFVGDADQLPPVGPGAPFHEIVRRRILPVATLEKIYRQGDGGAIAANAKRVNGGQAPAPVPGDPSYRQKIYPHPPRNLSQKEREAARERVRRQIAADVLDEVRGFLERGYRPDEIQVLTPTKRSSVGVAALNAALRPVLNPDGERRGVFKHGAVEFRVGDRVMHLVNDRAKGVYNGEIGTMVKILYPEDLAAGDAEDALWPRNLPAGFAVRYEAGDGIRVVEYTRDDCRNVALAFASTVHKAQGCEFPAVVFVMTWDSFLLLERNMLYTGLSRARKEIVVLAEEGALERAAAVADDAKRYQKLV